MQNGEICEAGLACSKFEAGTCPKEYHYSPEEIDKRLQGGQLKEEEVPINLLPCPDGFNCRSLGQDCPNLHTEDEQIYFATKLSLEEQQMERLLQDKASMPPPIPPNILSQPLILPSIVRQIPVKHPV